MRRRDVRAEEVRRRVPIVRETGKPIAEVARELGVGAGTLGNWVHKDRLAHGDGPDRLDAGDTFLLATARSEDATSGGLPEVARGDRIRRIDLERLDRGEFEQMLAGALGGEIVPATLSALWSVSLGNALFAHEIVMAAQAQGAPRVRHGVWRVHGRVPVVGRLGDVIAVRLGRLDQAERPVAELLALAAPVDLAELEDRFGIGHGRGTRT
jgi:transposase